MHIDGAKPQCAGDRPWQTVLGLLGGGGVNDVQLLGFVEGGDADALYRIDVDTLAGQR